MAYQLLARLRHLTLTVDNDEEYWEDKLAFVGTTDKWLQVQREETNYETNN